MLRSEPVPAAQHEPSSPISESQHAHGVRQVLRLLKQHSAADSGELLARAARAEADLERWYDMEGAVRRQLF